MKDLENELENVELQTKKSEINFYRLLKDVSYMNSLIENTKMANFSSQISNLENTLSEEKEKYENKKKYNQISEEILKYKDKNTVENSISQVTNEIKNLETQIQEENKKYSLKLKKIQVLDELIRDLTI